MLCSREPRWTQNASHGRKTNHPFSAIGPCSFIFRRFGGDRRENPCSWKDYYIVAKKSRGRGSRRQEDEELYARKKNCAESAKGSDDASFHLMFQREVTFSNMCQLYLAAITADKSSFASFIPFDLDIHQTTTSLAQSSHFFYPIFWWWAYPLLQKDTKMTQALDTGL